MGFRKCRSNHGAMVAKLDLNVLLGYSCLNKGLNLWIKDMFTDFNHSKLILHSISDPSENNNSCAHYLKKGVIKLLWIR